MAQPAPGQDLGESGPRRPRSVGVLLLVTVLVATVAVAATIAVSFLWSAQRARTDAETDARAQAQLAAGGLENSIARSSTALAAVAASPGVRSALAGPTGCRLSDATLRGIRGTHVDLVLPDGTVQCSSLAAPQPSTGPLDGSTAWLARAANERGVQVSPVLPDSFSGKPSLVVTAPVPVDGRNVASLGAVVPVAGLADALVGPYAGPRDFSFTIVDPRLGTVLSASGVADPARAQSWAASSHGARTGMWRGARGDTEIFGSSRVADVGWRVFAGLDAAAVTAAARASMLRQGLLAAVALLALAGLALLVSRRIVRPLQSVTRAVVAARDAAIPQPLAIEGPKEIATLCTEFNAMMRARVEYEEQLSQRALHDDLTGLPNRSLLRDRLERALASAPPPGVAVLFLDLDRFKLVNDGLGHPVGDALLQSVARRLEAVVRSPDTLARFGGDEFVVVCEGAGVERAVEVAREIVAVLEAPFALDGANVGVTAKIGIATSDDRSPDPDELVRQADIAMYHAKHTGRAWELWDEPLRTRSEHRLELTQDLRSAITNGELVVAYQPIWDLDTWRMVGAEALVRWHHPRLGVLPPSRFIGLAEDSGQIAAVGRHVLEHACTLAGALNREGHPFSVSVNVAEAQLGAELAPSVREVLARADLAAERLCLELTESSVVAAFGHGADALHAVRAMDVHIAIDDFGTGYSSLSYLQHFPFDTLKIDRSFVQPLGAGNDRSRALVEAILDVGRALGLRVIAEGVETPEQLGELRTLGCPYVQGFLLGRPVTPDEIESLARSQQPVPA